MSITSGLRFDSYQDIGSKLTIREALIYSPVEGTTIKGMFGQAYRAPSIHEFYGESLTTGTTGNSALKAETVDTTELSIYQQIDKTQLSLTWFNNSFKDGIQNVKVKDTVSGIDTFQPQNIAKLTTRGWEGELFSQLSDSFTLRAGLSHLNKLDDIGVAQTFGFWSFNYHHEQWNINLNGHYRGRVLVEVGNKGTLGTDKTIDAYTHWNAKIIYHINGKVDIYALSQNLFDRKYQNYTVISDLPEGVPMRERILKVGMNWKF